MLINDKTTLFNEIEEFLYSAYILIVNGYSINEPTIWILTVNDKSIELQTDQLETPAAFNNLYLQVFNAPAPYFKSQEAWHEFLKNLASRAKVLDITDYSVHLETARQVISYLYYSFAPEKNPEDLECLIEGYGDFVYVPIQTVQSFIQDLHFKTSMKVLARILEKRGIKKEPEIEKQTMKVCGQYVMVWELNYERMGEFIRG